MAGWRAGGRGGIAYDGVIAETYPGLLRLFGNAYSGYRTASSNYATVGPSRIRDRVGELSRLYLTRWPAGNISRGPPPHDQLLSWLEVAWGLGDKKDKGASL